MVTAWSRLKHLINKTENGSPSALPVLDRQALERERPTLHLMVMPFSALWYDSARRLLSQLSTETSALGCVAGYGRPGLSPLLPRTHTDRWSVRLQLVIAFDTRYFQPSGQGHPIMQGGSLEARDVRYLCARAFEIII